MSACRFITHHSPLLPFLVSLFLLDPSTRSVRFRIIVTRSAAKQSTEAAHAFTAKHSAQTAGQTAHHAFAEAAEQTAAVHLGHHLLHLFVLAKKLIDLRDSRTGT